MRKASIVAALLLLIALSAGISCRGYGKPAPSPAPALAASGNAVSISNFAFSPASITVPAGTKVTWTNNDSVAHTVSSRGGLFDSGSLSPKATFSYTFAQKGTYEYFCSFHSSMNGKVIVE
jgi:plastocyanin